jgi:hypothetical protein
MDPTLYYTFFIGCLALCIAGALQSRPATRKCPACGLVTPVARVHCRHCRYHFA